MATTTVICAGCGVSVEKPNGEINRARRKGTLLFCTKSCAIKTRRANYRKAYTIPFEKKCPRCNTVKPLTNFSPSPSRLDKRHSYCNACNALRMREHPNKNEFKIRRKNRLYGITPEIEVALLIKQGGVCAICKAPPPLAVDHNHATGTIRGLLCGSCNRGIGLLHDNADVLLRAVRYLRQATARTKKTNSPKKRKSAV